MRLYLSSYRLGASAFRLKKLLNGGRRAAVIQNALDFIPAEARRAYETNIYDPKEELADWGIGAEELDLRDYFGQPHALKEALAGIDFVWAVGGNAFLLRRAMRQSGFDRIIGELLRKDALVYGGFSAGAVVATPSLDGIDIMDDPRQLVPGYDEGILWDGLGLVDFSIVPHYRSDHDEAEAAEKTVGFLEEASMPFQPLRDGEVIIVEGRNVTLLPVLPEAMRRSA
ncbi:dipeptidase E [Rhizobium sp. BK275]|uniref:Type 1 glutamine amidotransferase-like domain-containing protein n=1 Tax=Rhizobium sp. BK275 TaxID=2587077 RepID=UPI00160E948F|nr:Type 1 glutamine amidotransferase-like domain-containing protein [Rhizobium sp. BK275]MBB3388998.1 dipeptidase E [Rhizobium sp. BK275]